MKPYKRREFTLIFIFLAFLALILIFFILDPVELWNKVVESLYNDSNRTPLYMAAVDCFKKYPIFGVGLGFYNDRLMDVVIHNFSELTTFNFHSVIFEVMATMGIVGILAYGFYYYKRIRILGKNNSNKNFFLMFGFIGIELYAFIDTCEFVAVPIMIILTMLILFTEAGNKRDAFIEPLPLTHKVQTKKYIAI